MTEAGLRAQGQGQHRQAIREGAIRGMPLAIRRE